jgi:hypothetical protein
MCLVCKLMEDLASWVLAHPPKKFCVLMALHKCHAFTPGIFIVAWTARSWSHSGLCVHICVLLSPLLASASTIVPSTTGTCLHRGKRNVTCVKLNTIIRPVLVHECVRASARARVSYVYVHVCLF